MRERRYLNPFIVFSRESGQAAGLFDCLYQSAGEGLCKRTAGFIREDETEKDCPSF